MRLTSYNSQGLPSYGVWQDGRVIDVPALYASQGVAGAPSDVLEVIERGQNA